MHCLRVASMPDELFLWPHSALKKVLQAFFFFVNQHSLYLCINRSKPLLRVCGEVNSKSLYTFLKEHSLVEDAAQMTSRDVLVQVSCWTNKVVVGRLLFYVRVAWKPRQAELQQGPDLTFVLWIWQSPQGEFTSSTREYLRAVYAKW